MPSPKDPSLSSRRVTQGRCRAGSRMDRCVLANPVALRNVEKIVCGHTYQLCPTQQLYIIHAQRRADLSTEMMNVGSPHPVSSSVSPSHSRPAGDIPVTDAIAVPHSSPAPTPPRPPNVSQAAPRHGLLPQLPRLPLRHLLVLLPRRLASPLLARLSLPHAALLLLGLAHTLPQLHPQRRGRHHRSRVDPPFHPEDTQGRLAGYGMV